MTTYVLFNANAVFAAPTSFVPPKVDGPNVQATVDANQTFQLIVTGGAGQLSATAQLYVTNDGVHYSPYMDPISVTGTNGASIGFGGSQKWNGYAAVLTAISGTAAVAKLLMNG